MNKKVRMNMNLLKIYNNQLHLDTNYLLKSNNIMCKPTKMNQKVKTHKIPFHKERTQVLWQALI